MEWRLSGWGSRLWVNLGLALQVVACGGSSMTGKAGPDAGEEGLPAEVGNDGSVPSEVGAELTSDSPSLDATRDEIVEAPSDDSSPDGTVPDAMPDGTVEANGDAAPDAIAMAGGDLVACGNLICSTSHFETCCAYQRSPSNYGFTCDGGVAQTGGCYNDPNASHVSELNCANYSNCPSGSACCLYAIGSGLARSFCNRGCGVDGGASGATSATQLCNPNTPQASECPTGISCSTTGNGNWGLPLEYGTCGGT
jgi:hypothetical protein